MDEILRRCAPQDDGQRRLAPREYWGGGAGGLTALERWAKRWQSHRTPKVLGGAISVGDRSCRWSDRDGAWLAGFAV